MNIIKQELQVGQIGFPAIQESMHDGAHHRKHRMQCRWVWPERSSGARARPSLRGGLGRSRRLARSWSSSCRSHCSGFSTLNLSVASRPGPNNAPQHLQFGMVRAWLARRQIVLKGIKHDGASARAELNTR